MNSVSKEQGIWIGSVKGFWAIALMCSALVLGAQEARADHGHRAYTVIVANNSSVDPGVAPLRYADDDGARYWEVFSRLTDEVHLLATLDGESQRVFTGLAPRTRPPSRQQLLETLASVKASIARDRREGLATTLYVIFTGHGAVTDEGVGYLSLLDGPFDREALHEAVIAPELADRTHVIIDACNAYFMVSARNGQGDDRSGKTYDDEFAQFIERSNQLSRSPTVGIFLSTTGAAEVHEWSRYRGGVFSHQLRSGMLGAADVNGDLKVSYQELEAYLAAANASVTNPAARVNVYAQPPAQFRHEAMLDLGVLKPASFLELQPGEQGRFFLEDSRGVRQADFHSSGEGVMRVALMSSPLEVLHFFLRDEQREAKIMLPATEKVRLGALSFVERSDGARGSVEESYRKDLFATPFGPGFFAGYSSARDQLGERPALRMETPDAMMYGFQAAVGVAHPPLGLEGVHMSADLALDLWVNASLGVALLTGYGTSNHDAITGSSDGAPFQLHQWMLGVGVTRRWFLPASLKLDLFARTGHQWLLYSSSKVTRADSLAFKCEVGGVVSWGVSAELDVGLRLSGVLDVFTVDTGEEVGFGPHVGVVLGYRR